MSTARLTRRGIDGLVRAAEVVVNSLEARKMVRGTRLAGLVGERARGGWALDSGWVEGRMVSSTGLLSWWWYIFTMFRWTGASLLADSLAAGAGWL